MASSHKRWDAVVRFNEKVRIVYQLSKLIDWLKNLQNTVEHKSGIIDW